MKKYRVTGPYYIEVEAENDQEAKEKAGRILIHSGIPHQIMLAEKIDEDNVFLNGLKK